MTFPLSRAFALSGMARNSSIAANIAAVETRLAIAWQAESIAGRSDRGPDHRADAHSTTGAVHAQRRAKRDAAILAIIQTPMRLREICRAAEPSGLTVWQISEAVHRLFTAGKLYNTGKQGNFHKYAPTTPQEAPEMASKPVAATPVAETTGRAVAARKSRERALTQKTVDRRALVAKLYSLGQGADEISAALREPFSTVHADIVLIRRAARQ